MTRRTSADQAPAAPGSFATVARKISGWTTNLIATGMILALALGLGRQLVGWWRIDPQQVAPTLPTDQVASAADPWGTSTLEFGDSLCSIDQRLAAGDRAQAREQLLASCRKVAAECAPPALPPSDAELQLLETAQALEPLQVSQGVRFYGPDTGFPLVVAVASPDAPHEQDPPDAQLGALRDRVLVWGIAAPAGDQVWSLYTFRLGEPAAAAAADLPSVPLPPGSRRTMALRDAHGVTLVAFAGSGTADQWRQSFTGQFSRAGWSTAQNWQRTGDVWHARYARGDASRSTTADVQFGPDPAGRLSGLVRIVPATAPSAPASGTQREQ